MKLNIKEELKEYIDVAVQKFLQSPNNITTGDWLDAETLNSLYSFSCKTTQSPEFTAPVRHIKELQKMVKKNKEKGVEYTVLVASYLPSGIRASVNNSINLGNQTHGVLVDEKTLFVSNFLYKKLSKLITY